MDYPIIFLEIFFFSEPFYRQIRQKYYGLPVSEKDELPVPVFEEVLEEEVPLSTRFAYISSIPSEFLLPGGNWDEQS